MNAFAQTSACFGVVLSLTAFWIGTRLQQRWKWVNPLLVSGILVIAFLLLTGIEYEAYNASAKMLGALLTPATVALAVPLYEKLSLLRSNWKAILAGILSGVLSSMLCILALCALFGLNHQHYVTLLPKSVTTAIGMGVSEELGGFAALTVVVIVTTGIFGNLLAQAVCRVFGITHPIAKGVAIGTSAHAIGTVKALEMGKTEGAVSGLSIAVAGVLTVIFAPLFACIL